MISMQSLYVMQVNPELDDVGNERTYRTMMTKHSVDHSLSYTQRSVHVNASSFGGAIPQAILYMPMPQPTMVGSGGVGALPALTLSSRLVVYLTTLFAFASIAMGSLLLGMVPSSFALSYMSGIAAAIALGIVLSLVAVKSAR